MQDSEKDLKNKDKNNPPPEETKAEDRVYEVGYLLMPTIAGEEVPALYGNLKELVTSLGGEIIADEMPKTISLAYTMFKMVSNIRSKFDTAYFGWVKFGMNPEKILKLKNHLDLDPNFLRFLILKTVRENTIATKRFVQRDMSRRKTPMQKKDESEIVAPINKEEIDKEIDALVAI